MFDYKIQGKEVIFRVCPSCGNGSWNFQVNVETKQFHCWVCSYGGVGGERFLADTNLDLESSSFGASKVEQEDVYFVRGNWCMSLEDLKESDEGLRKCLKFVKDRRIENAIKRFYPAYGEVGRFKDKLVMTLQNLYGEMVWLYGRSIEGEKIWVGLRGEKPDIMGEGDRKSDLVFVVEGAIDAARLLELGLEAWIWVLGGLRTSALVRGLSDYGFKGKEVVLMLDSDARGLQLNLFEALGGRVIFAAYPSKDPGELESLGDIRFCSSFKEAWKASYECKFG